ncbi:MAG TPA: glycosyltransferase family 2 protein [Verrucomicrobiae bacterium]|jgi:glycosyltransferase involved in cell wall biosynthesis|nr:glycosyltransferase family 2 protein [Verrucomicrobiae bacterium]
MEKTPLSVVIIAKNEEKRLEDCLQSVSWAAEIVVVDDNSTDKTVEIARRHGAKVFTRAMDYEGLHRNFAYNQATQPWVLSLDADERVTPELAEEIGRVVPKNEGGHTCYAMPMRIFLGDEWIRGAGYYPSARSKIFKKGEFRYEDHARVHPRAFYKGTCGHLKGELLHYSFRDMEDFLRKFNRETTFEAEKWMRDGRKVSLPNILRKTVDRFWKNYLIKGGWRCGFLGYLMSVFHSLYQIVSYAKYRELKAKGNGHG